MSLRRLVVPGVLLAAALTVYWPILLGGSYAMRDFLVWTLPSRALIRNALLEGRLPLWHPYLGLGMPAVAEPVNGVFYPLHLLLPALPLVTGVNILYLVHVLIAAGGGYALGRACGADRTGSLASGLTSMLCGVTTSGWASGLGVLTMAWMPWCGAAAVRLGQKRGYLGIAAMVAALAPTTLAGDPFQFIRAGLLAIPLAVGGAIHRGRRHAAMAVLRLAAAGGLALLVVAAAVLPGLAWLGESERAGGMPIEESERWSMHPVRMLEMVAPGALGDTTGREEYPGAKWVADSKLGTMPWALSVYLGFAAVGFSPLALRRTRDRGRSLAIAAVCALSLGVLLALGRYTPVHAVARTLLWPLQFFRYPEKYLDICSTAAAALVSMGVTDALRNPRAALPWVGGVTAALAVVAVPAGVLGDAATVAPAVGQSVIVGVTVLLTLELARRTGSAPVGRALLLAVLAFDLALAARPILRWTNAAQIEKPPGFAEPGGPGPPPRVYQDPEADDWPVVDPEHRAVLYARTLRGNLGVLYGFGVVPGYESAFSARWRRVWESVAHRGGRALRLFGVAHVVAARPLPDADLAPGPSAGLRIHAVKHPLPRAYLVGQSRLLGAHEDLGRALLSDDVVEGRAALVEDPQGLLDGAAERTGECSIRRYADERVDASCSASRESLLVLLEGWAPGWIAEIDGAPASLLRANAVARAVRMPAGKHDVVFRYRPRVVWVGIGISLFGVLATVWVSRLSPRSGTRTPPPDDEPTRLLQHAR